MWKWPKYEVKHLISDFLLGIGIDCDEPLLFVLEPSSFFDFISFVH
jgi:hypothetical protein